MTRTPLCSLWAVLLIPLCLSSPGLNNIGGSLGTADGALGPCVTPGKATLEGHRDVALHDVVQWPRGIRSEVGLDDPGSFSSLNNPVQAGWVDLGRWKALGCCDTIPAAPLGPLPPLRVSHTARAGLAVSFHHHTPALFSPLVKHFRRG